MACPHERSFELAGGFEQSLDGPGQEYGILLRMVRDRCFRRVESLERADRVVVVKVGPNETRPKVGVLRPQPAGALVAVDGLVEGSTARVRAIAVVMHIVQRVGMKLIVDWKPRRLVFGALDHE